MAAARCFPFLTGAGGLELAIAARGLLLRSTAVARMPLPHQIKNLRASVRVTLDLSSRLCPCLLPPSMPICKGHHSAVSV